METELRAAHESNFGTRLDPEPEPEPDPGPEYHHDSSPIYFNHPPQQPQIHAPMFQPQSQPRGLFDDDDKLKYIIPVLAFIFGFFMARTLNPIIIRST